MAETYVVNTETLINDPSDGLLTLREAIALATGQGDKIVFDADAMTGKTIELAYGDDFGPLDFSDAHGLIVDGDINGDGVPDVKLSGSNFVGIARISEGSEVVLRGLVMINAKGAFIPVSLPTEQYLLDNDIHIDTTGDVHAADGADAPEVVAGNVDGSDGQRGADAHGYPGAPGTPDGDGFDGRPSGAILNSGILMLDNVWMDGGEVTAAAGIGVGGGDGGDGSAGRNWDPLEPGYDQSRKGGDGGDGGNGGTGGDGGLAAPIINFEGATLVLNDTMISGFHAVGGAGGEGGRGGTGGDAGAAEPGDIILDSGTPGNGGDGGNGGKGGDAASVIANYGALILQTNYGAYDNSAAGGAGGNPGFGGLGGILFRNQVWAPWKTGVTGENGETIGANGTSTDNILQKGEVEGGGSQTPVINLMFMDVVTPSQLEGSSDAEAAVFTFNVVRFGDISEAATVKWKLDQKATDNSDYVVPFSTGTLNFGENVAQMSFAIEIKADHVIEKDETFVVRLLDQSTGVGLGTRSTFFTIVNDDKPTAFKDDLVGTDKDDRIDALAGNDIIQGMAGDDTLIGGEGKDRLTGGAGHDELTGSVGADTFVFAVPGDSVKGGQRDLITDFSHAQHDIIDLSGIDAKTGGKNDKFHLTGHGGDDPFTHHKGELRFAAVRGDTIIQADTNGDGKADMEIAVDGRIHFVASDFIL